MPADDPSDTRAPILALREEVGKVVVGQEGTLSGLVAALLVRGHVLLEGVPGTAKTLVVKAVAAALDLEFHRVQFTPDLMPSDVIGQVIFDARAPTSRSAKGPVFTNVLLADEINRTPPKTQAALLEAMEERQVTIEGDARPLPDPFVVVATQNPVEYEGTYPLPEAQLDRFLFKLNVVYPSFEQETEVLSRHDHGLDPHDLFDHQDLLGELGRPRRGARRGRGAARRAARAAVHRLAVPRDARRSVAVARRVAAWRHRAAARVEGLGVAVGSSVRDPRRGEGRREARPPSPHRAAPRGRARGHDRRRRARQHHERGPGTALKGR